MSIEFKNTTSFCNIFVNNLTIARISKTATVRMKIFFLLKKK